MKTREEDFVAQLIIDSTHAYLLCFTNTGRVYWVKIYEVPDVGAAGKGKAMASLVDLQPGEKVVTILGVRDLEEDYKYVLFATRNGTVKKTALKDFSNVMSPRHHRHQHREGRRAHLRPHHRRPADHLPRHPRRHGHPLQRAGPPPHGPPRHRQPRHQPAQGRLRHRRRRHPLQRGPQHSSASHAPPPPASPPRSRTPSTKPADSAIRPAARTRHAATTPHAASRRSPNLAAAAKLAKLDEKLGLTPCLILTVSENGFGKRTDVDAYRLQSRGGKGVISMKTTPKIGKVSAINLVDDTTEMMLISQFGKIIRIDTKTIRSAGRSTSGVKLLNLDTDDKVAAAVVIPPEDPKSQPENGTLLQ